MPNVTEPVVVFMFSDAANLAGIAICQLCQWQESIRPAPAKMHADIQERVFLHLGSDHGLRRVMCAPVGKHDLWFFMDDRIEGE